MTRDGEVVSGDSFAVYHRDSGEMILSISDGMAPGRRRDRRAARLWSLWNSS